MEANNSYRKDTTPSLLPPAPILPWATPSPAPHEQETVKNEGEIAERVESRKEEEGWREHEERGGAWLHTNITRIR